MSKDDRRLEGAAAFVSVSCGMDRANRSQPRTSSGGESRGECGKTGLNPVHRLEHAMCINHLFNIHMLSCFGCTCISQDTGLYYDRYLREVIEVLETDPHFREKLQTANTEDIKVKHKNSRAPN